MAVTEFEGDDRPTEADRAFQDWFWPLQRALWLVLLVFVAAGLSGLTGKGGPVSRGTATAGSASIEYPAVTRWQTVDTLRIFLPSATVRQAEVELPASLHEDFSVEAVTPSPDSVTAVAAGNRYAFATQPAGRAVIIRFDIRARVPNVAGTTHRMAVAGVPAAIRLVVLP